MKLNTSIQPRRNGVVIARGDDGRAWEFKPGEDGELSCDVTDEATAARLLATGSFYPASETDLDAALQMALQAQGDGVDEDDDDDDEDEGEGEGADLAALPVEAQTPVRPARKPRKPKADALA